MTDAAISQFSAPNQVKVTLLLSGGQQYTLFLKRDEPLLKDLMSAVVNRTQPQQSTKLFQIPIDGGYASLCITSADVIGVITQPPLLLQPATHHTTSVDSVETPLPTTSLMQSEVFPSNFAQLPNFLSEEDHRRLLQYVAKREVGFVPTQTSTGEENYRKSSILYDFPEFSSLIQQRIQAQLPTVLDTLDLPQFIPSEIEVQLTAHNDGNYYKVHNDNGSADTATRLLTYVYYFYREPKPFEGGELRIYDSCIENGFYVQADTYKTVEPVNNSIVFFLSRYLHEVLPISCPSREFVNSRFTVNGWIRQG
ncbi:MAG: 2OG-Fe(II) oxygenase [Cyanobacteria bacterium P01_D01_bin.14]